MNWKHLNVIDDLNLIKHQSANQLVLIFKHSTRCSVSNMVLSRFERQWKNIDSSFYFLDLLKFRSISNNISDYFGIEHQSPQVLIIKDGKCVGNFSHNSINCIDLEKYTSS
jgi:bacillithiol system protein YtxJ